MSDSNMPGTEVEPTPADPKVAHRPHRPEDRSTSAREDGFGALPRPTASVILSTYNQPTLLERSLFGYSRQDRHDFEIVIADDGSGPETLSVIERYRENAPVPVVHVWQPDQGFRKARTVNLAVLRSRADYLIFSDGDCIPERRFVSTHMDAAQAGHYIVGGHVRLSKEQTHTLTLEDVQSGRFEELPSRRQRVALLWTHAKSLLYIAFDKRRKPKFYGLNFSVDRASFERVNGFDLTFENCGREDSDLRNRMQMAGVGARSLWHRTGVYHQHHPAHQGRLRWPAGRTYYNRGNVTAAAAKGLRELAVASAQVETDPSPPTDSRRSVVIDSSGR